MVLRLALPVLAVVAGAHRYLLRYAPVIIVVGKVTSSRPRPNPGAKLLALSGAFLIAVKAVSAAVKDGAPSWLNLVVLVLACDAIKVAAVAVQQFFASAIPLRTTIDEPSAFVGGRPARAPGLHANGVQSSPLRKSDL